MVNQTQFDNSNSSIQPINQTLSTDVDCGFSNSTLSTVDGLHFFVYVILNQIYLIVGVGGNVILLISFYKQSRSESAYGYQVYLTISKTLEVFSFSVFLTTLKRFSGAEGNEVGWFVVNYPLMWLTACVGPVAHMVFIVCSLLLTVSMSADRLFALTKPFVYKYINRKRHQLVAALLCFGIGLVSSVSDAFRYMVVREENHYKLGVDQVYVASHIARIGADSRTIIRTVGVVGLVLLNVAIVVIFRKRSKKVGQMTTNDQKEKARRAADRNLMMLNIYQSILMCINQIPHMGYHILAYAVPSFTACAGIAYAPTADAMLMLTDSIDLFVLMAANQKMRRMVIRAVCSGKCCTGVAQGPSMSVAPSAWNQPTKSTRETRLQNEEGTVVANGNTPQNEPGPIGLPSIELPKYDGDPKQWGVFWNAFTATVDSNPNLSPNQKLSYLYDRLIGKAKDALNGITVIDANYPVAISILKEKFESDGAVYSAIRDFLTVKEKRHLRKLIDELEQLGQSLEIGNDQSIDILLSKVPSWFQYLQKKPTDGWTLPALQESIQRTIQAMETTYVQLAARKCSLAFDPEIDESNWYAKPSVQSNHEKMEPESENPCQVRETDQGPSSDNRSAKQPDTGEICKKSHEPEKKCRSNKRNRWKESPSNRIKKIPIETTNISSKNKVRFRPRRNERSEKIRRLSKNEIDEEKQLSGN